MKVCQSLSGWDLMIVLLNLCFTETESNCDQSKFPCRSDKEIAVFIPFHLYKKKV